MQTRYTNSIHYNMKIYKAITTTAFVILSIAITSSAYAYDRLSRGDIKKAEQAIELLREKEINQAKSIAARARNTIVPSMIEWMLLKSYPDNAEFKEYKNFIQHHTHWPDIERLRRIAESKISDFKSPKQEELDFLERFPPLSIKGKIVLYAKQNKNIQELVKEYWIQNDFYSPDEEDNFLKNFSVLITSKEYIKRIDRLLWERKVTLAKKHLSKVSAKYRSLFLARMALQQNKKGVDKFINRVSENLKNDPGLLYDRIKWRQKRKLSKGVRELLFYIRGTMPYQHKWWDIKNLEIRELIKEKKYNKAYALLAAHGNQPGGVDFADAEWLAGWISLRFLDNPKQAYRHFYKMYKEVKYPISLARGAYWAGRAASANNNDEISANWYKIAAEFKTTFYGQLALSKIAKQKNIYLEPTPKITRKELKKFENNDLITAINLLLSLEKDALTKKFIKTAIKNAQTRGERVLFSELGNVLKKQNLSVVASKFLERHKIYTYKSGFPLLKLNKEVNRGPEKALILGIIRQESRFDEKAVSPAGARGLMQIMPSTAKSIAKELKISYSKNNLTNKPHYNVKLGTEYINTLLNKYNGFYPLAIAAYNAGPANVNKWVEQYGDPRKTKNKEEVIDWIELIPFYETRNYVQRVLENIQVYRLLEGEKVLKIEEDLVDKLTIS